MILINTQTPIDQSKNKFCNFAEAIQKDFFYELSFERKEHLSVWESKLNMLTNFLSMSVIEYDFDLMRMSQTLNAKIEHKEKLSGGRYAKMY